MRKVVLAMTALSLTVPAVAVPTAAYAHRTGYEHSHRYDARDYRNDRRDRRDNRRYDRRYSCSKGSGTTGLIVGGAGGALLGREIDGGRDRTTGTVLGAAVGALLGRHVDRNISSNCR